MNLKFNHLNRVSERSKRIVSKIVISSSILVSLWIVFWDELSDTLANRWKSADSQQSQLMYPSKNTTHDLTSYLKSDEAKARLTWVKTNWGDICQANKLSKTVSEEKEVLIRDVKRLVCEDQDYENSVAKMDLLLNGYLQSEDSKTDSENYQSVEWQQKELIQNLRTFALAQLKNQIDNHDSASLVSVNKLAPLPKASPTSKTLKQAKLNKSVAAKASPTSKTLKQVKLNKSVAAKQKKRMSVNKGSQKRSKKTVRAKKTEAKKLSKSESVNDLMLKQVTDDEVQGIDQLKRYPSMEEPKKLSGKPMNGSTNTQNTQKATDVKTDVAKIDTKKNASSKAMEYYEKGKSAFMVANYSLAQQMFAKSIEYNPNWADVYGYEGRSWYYLGHLDKALSLLEKAVKMKSDLEIAYVTLGDIFYEQRNLKKSEEAFKEAAGMNLNSPGLAKSYVFMRLGVLSLLKGVNELAIDYFNQAEKWDQKEQFLKPKDHRNLYYNRGLALKRLLQWKEAETDYLKSWQQDKSYPKVMLQLGEVYYQQQQYHKAILWLEKLIKQGNDDYRVWHLLGNVYDVLNKKNNDVQWLKKALSSYKKAYQLEPNKFEIIHNMGRVYLLLKDYKSLVKFLNKLSASQKSKETVRMFYALSYYHRKDYLKSIRAYREVLKLSPEKKEAYLGIGMVYLEMAQRAKTIDLSLLQKAVDYLELSSSFENIADKALISSYFELENQDKLIVILKKSLEKKPKDGELWYHLGRLYAVKKKWKDAIRYYEKAIHLGFQTESIYISLAKAYWKTKNLNLAQKRFESLLQNYPDYPDKKTINEYVYQLKNEQN